MFFFFVHCIILFFTVLSLDAMDVSGEQQIDVDHNIFKQRLDMEGNEVKETPEKEGQGHSVILKMEVLNKCSRFFFFKINK